MMMNFRLLGLFTLSISLLGLSACHDHHSNPPPAASFPAQPQEVHILAFNDFHGNLEPPKRFIEAPATADNPNPTRIPVGGVSYFADAIQKLRQKYPQHIVISAGDLVGASPLASSLFLDESTIDIMNDIQIDLNVMGNHEFDRGTQELLRLKNGGCQQFTSTRPCQINPNFSGAHFDFLAANVTLKSNPKQTLFPAYKIKTYAGIPIAFIGVALDSTPEIVSPSAIQDVEFHDEAETVNALIPQLKKQGIEAFVVVVHDGFNTSTPFNQKTCDGLNGAFRQVLDHLDSVVDVVITAHTHQSYICDYPLSAQSSILVTSAGQYGTLITDITLQLDPQTRDISRKYAQQIPIQSEAYTSGTTTVQLTDAYEKFNPTPRIENILNQYRQAVNVIASRVVGRATQSISHTPTQSGESPLGNLVADSQQYAALKMNPQGSDFALMNPGGVRADLMINDQQQITFGSIYAVQPFGNALVTLSLTGKQIRNLLEQQWSGANASFHKILQPSKELRYQYHLDPSISPRASQITVSGQPLDDQRVYRVTVNSFIADGGDNFIIFKEGTHRSGAGQDINAFEQYIQQYSPLVIPATDRIQVIS